MFIFYLNFIGKNCFCQTPAEIDTFLHYLIKYTLIMLTLKLSLGIIFLLLGWIFLFRPNLLQAINRRARDYIFNDRVILLYRKKLAVAFFALSLLALYTGLTSYIKSQAGFGSENPMLPQGSFSMYFAMQDYCDGRYADAVRKFEKISAAHPARVEVLEYLALAYKGAGNIDKAAATWRRILLLRPKDKKAAAELQKCIDEKRGKIR